MLFGNYRFECRLESEAILPAYKGSTIRGVFGIALKKVVCALKHKECDQCLLQQSCLYSMVFEASQSNAKNNNSRFPTPPPPFVLEPPLDQKNHYSVGSTIQFRLLLFGEYNSKLPYFIYAFDCMGRIGIGKRIDGKRGKFTLERVFYDDQLIYDNKESKLIMPETFGSLSIQPSASKALGDAKRLRLNLHTPLRLKFQNNLQAELPFHVLVRAMLRRISSLFIYYGDGEPSFDYKKLVHDADQIQAIESKLNWIDWRRYSNRQHQDMQLGGMVGNILYEGQLDQYLPLIEICSILHLGKQSTFGLGMISSELVK